MGSHSEAPAGAGISGSSALMISTATALNKLTKRGFSLEKNPRSGAERGSPGHSRAHRRAGLLSGHVRRRFVHRTDSRWASSARPCRFGRTNWTSASYLSTRARPRNSGINNWEVMKSHIDGNRAIHRNFDRIAAIAICMRDALEAHDWDSAGRLMREEWSYRRKNIPAITTPLIDRLVTTARKAGQFRREGLRRGRRRVRGLSCGTRRKEESNHCAEGRRRARARHTGCTERRRGPCKRPCVRRISGFKHAPDKTTIRRWVSPRMLQMRTSRRHIGGLAKTRHPDLNPDDHSAENAFKDLAEAYGILSDPKKRVAYDNLGSYAPDAENRPAIRGRDNLRPLIGAGTCFLLYRILTYILVPIGEFTGGQMIALTVPPLIAAAISSALAMAIFESRKVGDTGLAWVDGSLRNLLTGIALGIACGGSGDITGRCTRHGAFPVFAKCGRFLARRSLHADVAVQRRARRRDRVSRLHPAIPHARLRPLGIDFGRRRFVRACSMPATPARPR